MDDPLVMEAYARVRPNREPLHGIKISHSSLAQPLRFVTRVLSDVSLREEFDGSSYNWIACHYDFKLPESSLKDGFGEASLVVDGVSEHLRPHIDALASTGVPAVCDYFEWEVQMIAGVPNFAGIFAPLQTFKGLLIKEIDLSSTQASAKLMVRDYGLLNFPRRIFDAETFPALHG